MNTTSSISESPAERRGISEDIPGLGGDLDRLDAYSQSYRGARLTQPIECKGRAGGTHGDAAGRIDHDCSPRRQIAHRCAADKAHRCGRIAQGKLARAD